MEVELARVDVKEGFNLDLACPLLKGDEQLEQVFKNFLKFILIGLKNDNFIYSQQGYQLISELQVITFKEIDNAHLGLSFKSLLNELPMLMVALDHVFITTDLGIHKIIADYSLNEKGALAIRINPELDWSSLFEYCFEVEVFKEDVLNAHTSYGLAYEQEQVLE